MSNVSEPILTTITGNAVLLDADGNEASDQVPVTCEYLMPQLMEPGPGFNTIKIRIKEAPVALIPNRAASVRAVIIFDEESAGRLNIGDWLRAVEPDMRFVISQPTNADPENEYLTGVPPE